MSEEKGSFMGAFFGLPCKAGKPISLKDTRTTLTKGKEI